MLQSMGLVVTSIARKIQARRGLGSTTKDFPTSIGDALELMLPPTVLRRKSMRPHAAISSSQYSWCSPPRTSRARIRQLAGNSCRWMLGRGRGLLSESGMPGPKLA
jgi:hypothetical protein